MSVGEGHNCHDRSCSSFSRRGRQQRSIIGVELVEKSMANTAELKLKKKVVLRQECRKAQPVLLQRRRWLPAERDPLQRGEEVF